MLVDVAMVKTEIKPKADSTLRNMRKDKLIEYIRTLEHNYNVAVSFNRQQAENFLAMEKKPLTLEELKQIEGPVLVCYPQETFGPQHPLRDNMSCSRDKFSFNEYGKTWVAFPYEADGRRLP